MKDKVLVDLLVGECVPDDVLLDRLIADVSQQTAPSVDLKSIFVFVCLFCCLFFFAVVVFCM